MEPQRAAKQWPFAFIAVLAASAFAFLFGIGRLGFLGPDEPRYAEVAREMFASGDYISTTLCGCLWFEKPALIYWMSAAGYHILGVGELGARVPSALAALATVAIVYAAVRRLGSQQLALATSVVLATSGIFVAYARVATPDMILTMAIAAALFAASLATRATGRARSVYWTVSFGFMGLGMLAKGLVGVVLVLAILCIYLPLTGQLSSVRWRDCIIGFVVLLAVIATWYVPVTMRHGWSFIDEFFIRHHFQRYTSNEFGHPGPVYFFVLVALGGAAPWTFFLIPAAARIRSLKPRLDSRDSLLVLAWIWVVVPLLFFSFSGSKLPGYILPVLPALAVVVGVEIERFVNKVGSRLVTAAAWLTGFTLVGMAAGFIIFLRSESIDVSGWRWILDGLPVAIALLSIVALALGKRRKFLVAATGVVLSMILGAVILLFPTLEDEVSLKTLSLDAAAALRPGEKIGFYLKKAFAPVFYADGRVLCDPRRGTTFNALHEDMLAFGLESQSSLVVITDGHWLDGIENDPRFATELIGRQGEAVALRVSLKKRNEPR